MRFVRWTGGRHGRLEYGLRVVLGVFARTAGQANKCTRWMPRHESAMKDVASCEKLRGAASERRSGDVRMGKPVRGHTLSPEREPTQGTETSKYLQEEKSNEIPLVAASERGRAQTGQGDLAGVVGPRGKLWKA